MLRDIKSIMVQWNGNNTNLNYVPPFIGDIHPD